MTLFKKLSHQTQVLPGKIQNHHLAFLFITLQECIEEKVKVVIVKQSAALCATGLPYLLRKPVNFAPDRF